MRTDKRIDFVLGLVNQSCPRDSPAPVIFTSGSVPVYLVQRIRLRPVRLKSTFERCVNRRKPGLRRLYVSVISRSRDTLASSTNCLYDAEFDAEPLPCHHA